LEVLRGRISRRSITDDPRSNLINALDDPNPNPNPNPNSKPMYITSRKKHVCIVLLSQFHSVPVDEGICLCIALNIYKELLNISITPIILDIALKIISVMSSPLPVILCGKTEQIGISVIALLQPEYEGLLFVFQSLFDSHS
jgi:hypothetical protein